MGWTLKEKRARNQRLVDYAREHPDATQKTLGGIFHLSPTRVCRILKKASEETTPTISQAAQDGKRGGLLAQVITFFKGTG